MKTTLKASSYLGCLACLTLGAALLPACGSGEMSGPQSPGDGQPPGPGDGQTDGTSMVSVLAGIPTRGSADGTGTAARFNGPLGLAMEPGGDRVYIADSFNHTLRLLELSSGRVTTLAGAPGQRGAVDGALAAARFNEPRGLALAPGGRVLYVADGFNYTIRQVDLMAQKVTTLAGSPGMHGSADGTGGAARFDALASLTLDPTGARLYIADRGNQTVRQLVLASGAVTTLAGAAGKPGLQDGAGAAANFNSPSGLALDPGGGKLFIADAGNHVIRQLELSSSKVTTLAGLAGHPGNADGMAADARFTTPRALATDGTNLFVAGGGHSIRQIVLSSTVVSTLAGSTKGDSGSADGTGADARFGDAYAMAGGGPGGWLYLADWGNSNLRRVSTPLGEVKTLAGAPEPSGSRDGPGSAARFMKPGGIATDPGQKEFYVSDTGNHTLRRVHASGMVETLAGQAGLTGNTDDTGPAARFRSPAALALAGSPRRLYVADGESHVIRAIDPDTAVVTTLAGTADMSGYADGMGKAASFDTPSGLAASHSGQALYVADQGNNVIRRVELPAGNVTTLAGTAGDDGSADGAGAAARFSSPASLAIDSADRYLYVADLGNAVIRRIDLKNAAVATLAGTAGKFGAQDGTGAAARFRSPAGISMSSSGQDLNVADIGNDCIRRIDIATGTVTTYAGALGKAGGLSAAREPLATALLHSPNALTLGAASLAFTAENAIYLIEPLAPR